MNLKIRAIGRLVSSWKFPRLFARERLRPGKTRPVRGPGAAHSSFSARPEVIRVLSALHLARHSPLMLAILAWRRCQAGKRPIPRHGPLVRPLGIWPQKLEVP